MHPKFRRADHLSHEAISAAIEVHRMMGPGLLESIYEKCLKRELELRRFTVLSQQFVEIAYKGIVFTDELRFDLLVEGVLLIEVKAVESVLPIHKAQC